MKRPFSYLYEPILAVPASIAVLMIVYAEFGLAKPTPAACLYLLLTCAACALFRSLDGRDRLLLLGAAAAFLLIPALYGLRGSSAAYHYNHRYLWLLPLLGVGCDLCAALCRRFRAARYTAAAAVIAVLATYLFLEEPLPKMCVVLFLCVLLLLFTDETQLLWRKSGHTEHTLHLTYIAPFIAVWLILALLMPTSDRPYDWRLFKNIWHRIEDFAVSLTQKTSESRADDIDVYRLGFSDDASRIGGDLTEDNRTLLLVTRTGGSPASSVYLAGKYCDSFDDLAWISTVTADTDECGFDIVETLCAFERTEHAADYLHDLELRITYRDFRSRYMLAPDKASPDKALLADNSVSQEGRNLVFAEPRGMNSEYRVSGYRLNLLHDIFLEYMRAPEAVTETDWSNTVERHLLDPDRYSYARYLEYRERVYAQYLRPFTVSAATQAFIDDTVGDADNAFERLMLLAQKLGSFTYTRTPEPLPGSVHDATSFLDAFLTSQQGYCSHYATAMTLLARAEGLPARYVYGFYAPLTDGGTPVTAGMSHAWCEVYFDNIGWITFDATPGHTDGSFWYIYSEREQTPWTIRPQPTPAAKPTVAPATTESDADESNSRFLLFLLIGVAVILLLAIPVLRIDRILITRRFERMSAAEQIPVLYRRNSRLLRWLDLPIREQETLTEYRERLLSLLPDEAVDWLASYEARLYGASADAKEVTAAMLRGNRELGDIFRQTSPFLYRLYRFVNRLI